MRYYPIVGRSWIGKGGRMRLINKGAVAALVFDTWKQQHLGHQIEKVQKGMSEIHTCLECRMSYVILRPDNNA